MERTFGPTPTVVAQDSRRPLAAVAGMTMPEFDRRSPSPYQDAVVQHPDRQGYLGTAVGAHRFRRYRGV